MSNNQQYCWPMFGVFGVFVFLRLFDFDLIVSGIARALCDKEVIKTVSDTSYCAMKTKQMNKQISLCLPCEPGPCKLLVVVWIEAFMHPSICCSHGHL
jgi:hypothetical protein